MPSDRLLLTFFLLIFRESPENMDFLEEKEQKVLRYTHIFTRFQVFRTINQTVSWFDSSDFLHQMYYHDVETNEVPVQTTPEKFEKGFFFCSENASNVNFSVHTAGKLEDATTTGHFAGA